MTASTSTDLGPGEEDAETDDITTGTSPPEVSSRLPRVLRVTVAVVLGVQLAGLLAYSTFLFHRFDLTDDFGTYSQAWWLIGHGHLNPVDTIQTPAYPFWQSHFELAMWPVALVGRLWPNPVQLLWLQDVAIVGTEWVAMAWVSAVAAAHRRGPTVGIAALVFLVVNPWWYQAASFDVHFELLGLPFAVWSAYSLWRGRTRTCLMTASVAVLFGDVVTVTILCVALAGVLSRRVRRTTGVRIPLLLGMGSIAWLAMVTLLGGNKGSGIVDNYGYLVGAGPTASSSTVLGRLALHPWHALRVVVDRRAGLARVVASAGLLGVITPWGLTVALGTLGPSALNANQAFLTPTIAFQTIAVIPFVFVGTVMVLLRIGTGPVPGGSEGAPSHRAASRRMSRPAAGVAIGLAVVLATLSVVQGIPVLSSIRGDWWRVDAPTAAALRTVLPRVPGSAEVIASQGVLGRFAGRTFVYPLLASPQAFPVHTSQVVLVVVADQGLESIPPADARAVVVSARSKLHATTTFDRDGVVVLTWRPPPGVTGVVLP